MENKIKITTFDEGVVVKIYGELDSYKTLAYKDKIVESIRRYEPQLLLFDLKELTFLDSAGIGLILGRYNDINKVGGKVGLLGLNDYSRKIVKITGLFRVMEEYKSMAAFRKEAKNIL